MTRIKESRHPNTNFIVMFLGVCPKPGYKLPVLVMEKLDGNLDDLLEGYKNPDLPMSLKLSILNDVLRGLNYLHNYSNELTIIHRDLTARNVLLTSQMTAKITDFGNSRIVNKTLVQKLTSVPGTLVYMPPEAMTPAKYGPSLDMFSFGHLSLVTLTQVHITVCMYIHRQLIIDY